MQVQHLVRASDPLTSVMAAERSMKPLHFRRPRVDLLGKRFGRLVVQSIAGSKNQQVHWNCLCDCGKTTVICTRQLNCGQTTSCGCYGMERRRAASLAATTTHGKSRTPIYEVWFNMIRRCENESHKSFKHYGARGIKVCDAWHSFEAFYADMGDRPSDAHTIDRKDNNGNYEPSNCRWATQTEQARNRRSSRYLTIFGETKTIIAWAEDERCQVSYAAFSKRVYCGWDGVDALLRSHRSCKRAAA